MQSEFTDVNILRKQNKGCYLSEALLCLAGTPTFNKLIIASRACLGLARGPMIFYPRCWPLQVQVVLLSSGKAALWHPPNTNLWMLAGPLGPTIIRARLARRMTCVVAHSHLLSFGPTDGPDRQHSCVCRSLMGTAYVFLVRYTGAVAAAQAT